jgi:hypothetical protein
MHDALQPVPQPYKTWIARPLFFGSVAILMPYAAAVESAGWCKEVSKEIKDAWDEVKDW